MKVRKPRDITIKSKTGFVFKAGVYLSDGSLYLVNPDGLMSDFSHMRVEDARRLCAWITQWADWYEGRNNK